MKLIKTKWIAKGGGLFKAMFVRKISFLSFRRLQKKRFVWITLWILITDCPNIAIPTSICHAVLAR